jgi:hypothetical protein
MDVLALLDVNGIKKTHISGFSMASSTHALVKRVRPAVRAHRLWREASNLQL